MDKTDFNEDNDCGKKLNRELGEIPEVADSVGKAACKLDFKLFCETYFPESFTLAWSNDHLKVIAKIEECVLRGGLFAMAMSRGSGKTTLTECAALWSMLYGHREFILLIGASEIAALQLLESIRTELEINERLAADFPEVCFPIAALEGLSARCAGQTYHGKRTRIVWSNKVLVLPNIEGSAAAGCIVRAVGITGRIRGAKFKRPDGKPVRPSLVIIDDPQTHESAMSALQTQKRIRILSADILGLAGPDRKISGIMPCTIIRPGDMADRILNRDLYPDWNGEKTKMLYSMPSATKLWAEYAEIRAESLRIHGDISEATAFYAAHRAEMDKGAVVSWPARFNSDELSAIQHAMNLKFRDEYAFMSEYQNDPVLAEQSDDRLLDADYIMRKTNGLPQGGIPLVCDRLTVFIDIQKTLLFYVVAAWSENFTGSVIEYGAWPKQIQRDFTLHNADPTIQMLCPSCGIEGGIMEALTRLTDDLFSREWQREDGMMFRVERCLIDANWGQSTDVVYQFCRQSRYSGAVMPAHGRYVGAGSIPMTHYRKHPGDRMGFNWIVPGSSGKRVMRHVIFDSNFWKSFIFARLAVPNGDSGSLTLFGGNPECHRMFAGHLTAEYWVRTSGRGRSVDEWKLKPNAHDNHWFDCLVGCAVGASMQGCSLQEVGGGAAFVGGMPKSFKLSEVRRQREEEARIREEIRASVKIPNPIINKPKENRLCLSKLRRRK